MLLSEYLDRCPGAYIRAQRLDKRWVTTLHSPDGTEQTRREAVSLVDAIRMLLTHSYNPGGY